MMGSTTTKCLMVILAASMSAMARAEDAAPQPAAPPASPAPAPAPAGKVQTLPAGQTKPLQAVVMDVKGSAEWRSGAEAAWQTAKVDDLLSPGTQIRTGRASGLTLRAGHNATVMVAAMTRVDLPEILQDGATLRTRAGLVRGKADFKVDQVGLVNDFEVITPSSTLAVRGTGFGVRWGGLDGASVQGLAGNEISAIELKYFTAQLAYQMSGKAISNEKHPNPVIASLYNTITPPPVVGKIIEAIEAALASGLDVDTDFTKLRDIDVSVQSAVAVSDFLIEVQSPVPPEFDITIPPGINPSLFFAQLLCTEQSGFTSTFQNQLQSAGLFDPQVGNRDFTAFTASFSTFCSSLQAGTFTGDDPFLQIVLMVQSFCGTYDGQVDFDHCITEAGTAMGLSFVQALTHH